MVSVLRLASAGVRALNEEVPRRKNSPNYFAHSDKRGKPGGFPGALIRDKIVTDGEQFAGSQDFASGEHNFIKFEKCFLSISYGIWPPAIGIDTICRVVIIVTVGKTGNSLLFQLLALQGDWRKIEPV